MSLLKITIVLLAIVFLGACTTKPKTESPKQEAPTVVADPTPPDPPNSVEVSADIKIMPAFLTLAIGGIGNEGEKEGIEMQENFRLFRTNAAAQEIVAFYQKEMKNRGWTTDNQVAQSGKVGLTMQEYSRAGTEALYLIISEPEDSQSSDDTKSKRHIALLPAKIKKTRP
jgi:hypothetical protein